jgi:hypothetical protein
MPRGPERAKRSRIAVYGQRRIKGVDMRSSRGRRFRSFVDDLSRDLGGLDRLSAVDQSLIRQAACLMIQVETMQGRVMRGEPGIDVDEIIRLSSEVRRCLQAIRSADQQASDSVIDLKTYAASIAGQVA